MSTATLKITGMSCGHCVASVTNALKALDGVQVEDVRIGSARVAYDEARTSATAIAQAVTEDGYLATVSA